MTHEPKPDSDDQSLAMLEAQQAVVSAVLDYECARQKKDAAAYERLRSEMFRLAHRVEDMRLENLRRLIASVDNDPGYHEYLRRN